MSDRTGLFVVFEGIDGAGTTTQARRLEARVRADPRGRRLSLGAEPSMGPVGTLVRHVLRERVVAATPGGERRPFDRRALALLFAADRLDHVACEIAPLVDDGWVVISDRYVLSSLAYQGLDAPVSWIAQINRFAPPPDVMFFLEVPAETAWGRIRDSRPGREIFETPGTLAVVADAYRAALPHCPARRVETIDGSLGPDVIADRVWSVLDPMLS
jgi:dTMP kinase